MRDLELTVPPLQCHHNSLLIYGSLRTPTLDRFAQVTHVSTTISVIACLCMSTSGFLVFTDRTQGNILNNFSEDDMLINIARLCVRPLSPSPSPPPPALAPLKLTRAHLLTVAQFGANMFSTLPLEAFVCREVAETYFWPDEREFNKKRHVLITTALVLSALVGASSTHFLPLNRRALLVRALMVPRTRAVSLITCDLGFILELAGGFSATALAYLFRASSLPLRHAFPMSTPLTPRAPPLARPSRAAAACFLRLSGTGRQLAPQRLAAWACATFGILVMVLSTFLSIRKAVRGESHKVC